MSWLRLLLVKLLLVWFLCQTRQVSIHISLFLLFSLNFYTLESSLNRLRRQTTPPLPKSSSFDLPDIYSITTSGVPFLFSDTLVRKKRVILFASDEQLRMLFSSTHIMMDGTFSSCVPYFDQVFSIHCIKYGYSKSSSVSKSYLLVNFCLQIFRVSSEYCQAEVL
jgi:hypothetical protein